MDKEEKKRYLNRLYKKKDIINSYEIELKELKNFSNAIDNKTNLQKRIQELEGNICMLTNEYVEISKEIEDAINTVNNDTYKTILRYRHINFMRFESIAKRMGYSPKHIYCVYNKALEKVNT